MSQDFSKAKIYKITNDYNNDIYIGSTCDTIVRRFSCHKCDARREKYKNRPLYKLMNELGSDRFRIQLICDYPCEDKYQLRQKEGEYIRQIGTLNKNIAGRTDEQYDQETKDKKREYKREYIKRNKEKISKYNEDNKEHIQEYMKQYREKNQETLKAKKQEYRDANRDKINEQKRNHYSQNRERIRAEQNQKYNEKKLSNNQNIVKIST